MKKILLFIFFFILIPNVNAEEIVETYTDPENNLSISYNIDKDKTPYVFIRKDDYCTVNSSHYIHYDVYISSEPFTVSSSNSTTSVLSNSNYTTVMQSWQNFNGSSISSCTDYSVLEYKPGTYFTDMSADVYLNKTNMLLIYNNYDLKNKNGEILFPKNEAGSGGEDPNPEEPEEGNFFDQLFEMLKLWLIPDPDDISFIINDLVTTINSKFPFIEDIFGFFTKIDEEFSPGEHCDGDDPDCSYLHPALNPFPRVNIPILGLNNVELIDTKFIDDNRYIIMNCIKAFLLLDFVMALLHKIPHLSKGGK